MNIDTKYACIQNVQKSKTRCAHCFQVFYLFYYFPLFTIYSYFHSGLLKSLTKMKRLLQGCSSVAATMQQSNMYAAPGGDKVAN